MLVKENPASLKTGRFIVTLTISNRFFYVNNFFSGSVVRPLLTNKDVVDGRQNPGAVLPPDNLVLGLLSTKSAKDT